MPISSSISMSFSSISLSSDFSPAMSSSSDFSIFKLILINILLPNMTSSSMRSFFSLSLNKRPSSLRFSNRSPFPFSSTKSISFEPISMRSLLSSRNMISMSIFLPTPLIRPPIWLISKRSTCICTFCTSCFWIWSF